MESKQTINSSSIIDLKAELFRKQEQFKQQKLQSNNASFIKSKATEKKPTIWSKQNAGVLQRAQKDKETKVEEEDQNEKSRKALERKTKLYEEISKGKGIPEEDGSKVFLVDFQKKAIDNIRDERDKQRKEEERLQEEDIISDVDVPPKVEGEEWVDYTDSLGRSRRCMKQDLPKLIARDNKLQGKETIDSRKIETLDDVPTLLSDDMRKEMLRQKWEKEELEAMNGPIHYSNVRYDETRSHGVGFFDFDKSEEGRQEQLDTLHQLRKQTVEERSRKEKLKEKRKAALDARLAKVKQRKMLREGGILGPDVQLKDESEVDIGPKIEEMTSPPEEPSKPELLTRDESARLNKPTREWDKGKEKMFSAHSEENYYEERRDERNPDFAPPMSLYSDNTSKYQGQQPKRKPPMQSGLFSSRHEVPSPTVIYREDIVKQSSKKKDKFKKKEEEVLESKDIEGSVWNIPLPSDPSVKNDIVKCDNIDSNISSSNLPLFDFSVPPPNMVMPPNFQQTSVQNQDFYSFPGSNTLSSNHLHYPTDSLGHQSDYPMNLSLAECSNFSQQEPAVGSRDISHVTPAISMNQDPQNVLSSTQAQSCTASSSTTVTQPSKPKLNIIDPRFIQNQDVLLQNPGNMSHEQNISAEKEHLQSGNETLSNDSESVQRCVPHTSTKASMYSANPVVYK